MSRMLAYLVLALIGCRLIVAQSAPPSDPKAVSLATQSVSAMAGPSVISDVTLSGSVTRILGADKQSGTATLLAKGFTESRVDLALDGGARSEVRNSSTGPSVGNWTGPDGAIHPIAGHNCATDASWFFPALGLLAAGATDPNIVLTYVGKEGVQSSSFQHIQAHRYNPYLHEVDSLSVMDFYLDAHTLLPSIVMFNEHPDTDQAVNIAVQVMLSDYRNVNGTQIPFRIQRYVNDSLTLVLQISSANINTGVSDSKFNLHRQPRISR
jgi:hypothetical protein